MKELQNVALEAADSVSHKRSRDDGELKGTVKSAVSSYLFKNTRRNPMDHPRGDAAVKARKRPSSGRLLFYASRPLLVGCREKAHGKCHAPFLRLSYSALGSSVSKTVLALAARPASPWSSEG